MVEPKLFKNLRVYESLVGIILQNKFKKNQSTPVFILKRDTIDMALNYLEGQNNSQGQLLLKLKKEKKIDFDRTFINRFNRKKDIIEIKYTKTIDDFLSLIYLFNRFLNYNLCYDDLKNLLSKTICSTEELRANEFLNNLGFIKDSKRQMNNNAYDNYLMAKDAKLELELYKIYKKFGKVEEKNLNAKLYKYYIEDRMLYKDINIDRYGKYLFECVVSVYINQKLKNKEIHLNDYNILKNNIDKISMDDISSILNLDISYDDGLFIPESDIKKLEKTYKIELSGYNE